MSNGGTLHTAVRDTARKHLSAGICVELQGLPGSGRSTAARAISAELEDAGWQVLAINGVQALHDRPLEALVIAGVMARQSNPQASTTAVSSAVQGLSSTIRTGSTLVVVDDADQLDGISAGALAAAFAQHHFPVLTVTTTGVEPHPGSLTTSLQPGVTLEVAPLDFVGVQTLLAEALGAPIEPSVVGRTFALSGGVAGIALALAEGARLTEDLRLNDGTWTLRGDLWTPGVGRALAPLLSALTPPQRIGLQTLALAGTVSLETARRLVSGEVLEELDQRGLLRFVIRDDAFLLSVFPLAINEHFTRQGVSMRHLEIAERLTVSMGGALESQPPAPGWQGAWTSAPGTSSHA
ncbi:MAG: hypothetical protein FWG11_09615, partial [Promicromonosporaceae bacterium]|nr:hypothetical protein [Promicromonosporaceae bacterium]